LQDPKSLFLSKINTSPLHRENNDPYPYLAVLSTGSKVFAIWTEANRPNVQVSVWLSGSVIKLTSHLAGLHVKDLRRSVTASSKQFTIL
jgi:hypothetical protein